jgi:hypothetical protein
MSQHTLIEHVALGAAAGCAATFLLQGVRTSEQKLLPETMLPMRDPGEFMVEQAEELIPEATREQVSATVEKIAGKSLAVGYGMTAGAIYGALRPCPGNLLIDGTALGLGIWAVGYLGWLPALGLMPPVQQQETQQVAGSIVQHVIFGLATVAANQYQWLHDLT